MYETNHVRTAERAILVGTALGRTPRSEADYTLDELARLIDTAGGVEVARFLQRREAPDSAYFVGTGLVDQVRQAVTDLRADLVVFDETLASNQLRRVALVIITRIVLMPVMPAITDVGEVIKRAVVVSVLLIESSFRRQEAALVVAQVPLADDGRAVPHVFERRWKCTFLHR